MFGYITINKPELKIKDYELYHSYYCGLCRTLKERYGRVGQATLTNDLTFVTMLLTGLYETEIKSEEHRCITHPGKKHLMSYNEITEYTADMNIVLAYHNMMDDWGDDRSYIKLAAARLLRSKYHLIEKIYSRQCQAVEEYIRKLQECEKRKDDDPDLAAGLTGEMLGEVFVYKEDEWSGHLRRMGFYLGKFIYLMDAYEDMEKDRASSRYNPFLCYFKNKHNIDIDNECNEILTSMMAECSREFEKLPVLINADILRNILYAGVWVKFELVQKARLRAIRPVI